MSSNKENTTALTVRIMGPLLPYAAVLFGVIFMGSAPVAIGIYHLGIIAILLASGGLGRIGKVGKGLRPIPIFLIGLPCLAAGAAVLLWPIVTRGMEIPKLLETLGLAGPTGVALAAYSLVANPLLEEVFWRDLLAPDTSRPALTDLLFGGYHAVFLVGFIEIPWAATAGLALAFAAWIWRVVSRRSGGLATPYVTHLLADLSVIAGVIYVVRG